MLRRDVQALKCSLRDQGMNMHWKLEGLKSWVMVRPVKKQGPTSFIIRSLNIDKEGCP